MDQRDTSEKEARIKQDGEVARIYITGPPGSGKSTLLQRLVEEAEHAGCRVVGLYAPEVRVKGRRIGFTLVDVSTGKSTWLARTGVPGRLRVGRYTVIEDADRFAWQVLSKAIQGEADLVVLDEIGPMELLLPLFRKAIRVILESPINQVAVFHRRLHISHPNIHKLILKGQIYRLDRGNWDEVYHQVKRNLYETLDCLHYAREV